ncbi:hypothetical protein M8J77_009500 [Diaphorina citri]|nr:hypothetical protein M8J77_009500 [Diaphorina citri]
MAQVAPDWNLGPGRPLPCTSFESPLHTSILLSGLSKLRSKNLLLDVTLVVEGEAFQAHKVVLASISDYFRAMFTDAMRESKQSEICLNGITARGMKLVLDYAYSARLELNVDNIQHVLLSASHVQIEPLVEACSSYLQSQLDLDNCVDIASIAETYSLSKLRSQVYRFMCSHLRQFSSSPEFARLSSCQLEYLLACDYPVDMAESDVLRICLQWLHNHTSGENKSLNKSLRSTCERIFRLINFAHISPNSAVIVNDPFLQANPVCAKALYTHCKKQQGQTESNSSLVHNPLLNSRGMELAIVKVGGFSLAGITNEITYYLPSVGKWKHLTSIPHVEQCNFGTAVLDNQLYVVGGCFNQALQEIIHPFGFIYNPMSNKWTTMCPLQRERCRFSLNVLGGRLIAIGGDSELVWSDLEDCELYDPKLDAWMPLGSPLAIPLPVQHAGVSHSTGLYVSGGLQRDQVCPSLWRYDLTTDTWERKACMPTSRADHVLVSIGDKIYACGGWYENAETRVIVDTIDMYSIEEDIWSTVTRVPTPRLHAGIVGVASKIYFIGGFLGDAMYDRGTARIECYDTETDVWSIYDNYPQEVWEHTCVTLYIPRCRDDMQVLGAG